ncbi:MAG: substrate-binding domain-containing protein [Anaerolineae bacterium]|nr:substrate-binding domain-containing protein [Anaerolineae bacterium]
MRRGTIIFILFVLVAGAVVGASFFLRSQPPTELTVAVNPLIAEWAREAVNAYNNTQPVINSTHRIQFSLIVTDDLAVWQGDIGWTAEDHPAAWIPAASASVDYADRYMIITPSVARTPLVWGGYASRVDVATDDGAQPFDWAAVQQVAEAESWSRAGGSSSWNFVKLAFPRADQSMSGMAALFSGAASFNDSVDISGSATRSNDFRNWMMPIIDSVPNFQTLGANPASAVARGPSTVEMALLPESQWLMSLNGIVSNEPVVFSYPAYQFMLDFPVAAWNSTQTADNASLERAAAEDLAEWLLTEARQNALAAQGLRPVSGDPDSNASLFNAGANYGIQLAPDFSQLVQAPTRTEAQSLVQWFSQSLRR